MSRKSWTALTRLSIQARISIVVIALLLLAVVVWLGGSQSIVTRLFDTRDHTWARMQDQQKWRVGLDPSFPPFEMLDGEGQPIGFDVDLARAIAGEWGMDVEIVALGFDSLLDAVAAGRIDSAVSAMPYDPRGTQDYAYSSAYFDAGIMLVVPDDSEIASVDDLQNRIVAVEWGSMGDMVGRRLQREGIELTLEPYMAPDEAVAALVENQTADALLIDNVTYRQAQGAGAPIRMVGPALESAPYVIVMPLDAKDLRENLELALQSLRDGGTLRELEASWFGSAE